MRCEACRSLLDTKVVIGSASEEEALPGQSRNRWLLTSVDPVAAEVVVVVKPSEGERELRTEQATALGFHAAGRRGIRRWLQRVSISRQAVKREPGA